MSQQNVVTIGGFECLLPDPVKYRLAWEKANSFRCPIGPATGRGFVLVSRDTLNRIPKDGPLPLIFKASGGEAGDGEVKLSKVYIHSGFRVNYGGKSDDASAAYLLRLVDKRYFLNRWTSTTRVFNATSGAGGDPDRYFMRDTLKDGTTYKWNDIAAQLWTDCKLLGAFTGLGAIDVPPPVDMFFLGVNPWRALNDLLDKIGRTVAYDPTADRFYIVALSNPAPGDNEPFGAAGNQRLDLLYDGRPFSGLQCVAPEAIRVHFYVKYEDYGSERDSEAVGNWAAVDHSTFLEIKTGVPGVIPGTTLSIWDDTPALRQHGNRSVFVNAPTMKTKAEARVAAWLKKNAADRYSRNHYIVNGAFNLPNDGVIRQVIWRNFGGREGLCTEVQKFPGLPADVDFDGSNVGSIAEGSPNEAAFIDDFTSENASPPDLMRRTFPTYPRLPNFVTVTIGTTDVQCDAAGSIGFLKPYEGTAVFGGYVIRYRPENSQMETLEPCWILVIGERAGTSEGPRLRKNEVLYARLSGKYEAKSGQYAGTRLPLYVARGEDMLSIENSCICGTDASAATKITGKCKVDHLNFDAGVGFEMYQPNNNEDGACVSIKGCQTFTVLNQWATNQRPVWTRSPIFGGNITTYGALKFGQQNENGRTRGGGSVRGSGDNVTLPRGAKTCCQPVQVKGVYGNCVEWEYGAAGPSGYLFLNMSTNPDGSSPGTYKIYLDCGRVVGVGSSGVVSGFSLLTMPSACPTAPCPPKDVPPCSPCENLTPPDYTPPGYISSPPYNPGDPGDAPTLPSAPVNFQNGPVYGLPGSDTESFVFTRVDTPVLSGQLNAFFIAAQQVRFSFESQRPLNVANQLMNGVLITRYESILRTFDPITGSLPLGAIDFSNFRNILQAVYQKDIEENPNAVEEVDEPGVYYDPTTGLKFKNETPSIQANFDLARQKMQQQFFSDREFTDWNEVYAVEDQFFPIDEGGSGTHPLEISEFLIFREVLYYWARQDLEA